MIMTECPRRAVSSTGTPQSTRFQYHLHRNWCLHDHTAPPRHTAQGQSHRQWSLSLCLMSSHAPSLAYLRNTCLSNKRLDILTGNLNYEEEKSCVFRFLVKTWGAQTAVAPQQGQRETPPEAPQLRGRYCHPETQTRS